MAERLRGWRKLAGSTWSAPNDPQFFGEMDIDAAPLMAYLQDLRQSTGVRVTPTHVVGKAVAHGLSEVPALRVRLARGRAHPREGVDVFFIVSTGGGGDLTGVKIADADGKPVQRIAAELDERLGAIARDEDATFGRSKAMLDRLPPRLLRATLRTAAWLTSDLNLDLSRLGMPRQAFGSAMITSVGMWGVERGFAPLAGYYRVPLLVLVGAVTDRPAAVDGAVVVRPTLTLTATFDHRYADGAHAARFAAAVRAYLADPSAF